MLSWYCRNVRALQICPIHHHSHFDLGAILVCIYDYPHVITMTETCMYFMCGLEIALMFLLVPIILLPLLYLFDKHYKKMCEKQGHKLVHYSTVNGHRAKVCSCGQNYWYTHD